MERGGGGKLACILSSFIDLSLRAIQICIAKQFVVLKKLKSMTKEFIKRQLDS